MPMRPHLKHVVEYAGLRMFATAVRVLPYRAALALGWTTAASSHFVAGFRAQAARTRIREVFGSQFTERDVRRTAWQAWRSVVFTGVDTLRIPGVTRGWMTSVCECPDFMETLRRHAATGQGAVLACPHMGAWELAAVICRLAGLPIFSVAATQKNLLANDYLNRLRGSAGAETIARGSGTMRQVIHRLREGGMLAILPDVRASSPALSVRFLGKNANVGKGMASFARATGVPIFPCHAVRDGWARHRIFIGDAIRPDPAADKDEDLQRMTDAVFAYIECAIRRRPEQWFWYNKRWILDPMR